MKPFRSRLVQQWQRVPRALRYVLLALLTPIACAASYLGASELLMRIPVNAEATEDSGDIEIYLVSNGVHFDIAVPAVHAVQDWRTWLPSDVPLVLNGVVVFGWGDRGFFLNVPTWDDLTPGVAIRGALWPTPSAMHVDALSWRPQPNEHNYRLRINGEQYQRLVDYITRSFALDESGRPLLIDHPGYSSTDRFFEGRGSYHGLRTCNSWTNTALKVMGRRAAVWAPFERNVRHHLAPSH